MSVETRVDLASAGIRRAPDPDPGTDATSDVGGFRERPRGGPGERRDLALKR